MANISLTTACNRECPYCFAAPAGTATHMSLATFETALDFLERSGIDQARLLGGEPTLHPEFTRFAELALRRGLRLLVFTNALGPGAALEWLADARADRVAVLVNATVPEPRQHRALEALGQRATLGFTIDSPEFEPAFLLDLIREFGLSPQIRFGLAHPVAGGSNRFLHPRNYEAAGRRLEEFSRAARAAGVGLSFDCGFPPCLFPAEFHCSPILDILPGGEVVSCYPLAALHREPLPPHETAAWLRERFAARLASEPRGVFARCSACADRTAGRCGGGCLALAGRPAPAPEFARADPLLPVFRSFSLFYAPGYVQPASAANVAPELRRHAGEAQARWQRLAEEPFAPECLTIYLNNRCNLACGYCYSAPGRRAKAPRLDEAAAFGAAGLVLRSCARKQRRFQLVLHGGGEPTQDWDMVVRLVSGTRAMAQQAGVGWCGMLATNGMVSAEQAAWLGRELELVELSCDGPPEIQDRQRPTAGGGPSSAQVERTARALRQGGARYSIRATITPETVERQAEIVTYLHGALGAREIRFEPVYGLRRTSEPVFRPDQADWFVTHYLAAQRRAKALDANLTTSGVRLDEVHGPFCDVLRQVLHVLPDGSATACFFATDGGSADAAPVRIGGWDAARSLYVLDHRAIAAHRRKALSLPASCRDCVNVIHCSRTCPERCCVLDLPAEGPSFRCLVQRRLAEAWIVEAAGY